MNGILPNTTQIPNEILDEWMAKLNGGEFKIVMIIARQTFGWIADPATGTRKKTDWIAYSQLCQKSGLTRTPVSNALRRLEELGYIEISDGNGNLLTLPNQRNGKKLYYGITSLKTREVDDNQSKKSILKTRLTKETNTKDIDNKLSIWRKNAKKSPFEVNFILQEFEKRIGHIPSDKFPRRVAHNIRQLIYTFIKENGGLYESLRGSPLTFSYVITKSWDWYQAKDYAQHTEKLETFKLKMKVYLDDVSKRLYEERRGIKNGVQQNTIGVETEERRFSPTETKEIYTGKNGSGRQVSEISLTT